VDPPVPVHSGGGLNTHTIMQATPQSRWHTTHYISRKLENWQQIRPHVGACGRLLDIGGGHGWEALHLQREQGTRVWVLERFDTRGRTTGSGTADTFAGYHTREQLRARHREIGLRAELVDADQPLLDQDLRFDVIWSFASCGFHYPVSTHLALMRRHSHEHTLWIINIRHRLEREHRRYLVLSRAIAEHPGSRTWICAPR